MSFSFISLESQSSFPTAEVQVLMVFDSVKNKEEESPGVEPVAAVSLQYGLVGNPVDSGVELLTQMA